MFSPSQQDIDRARGIVDAFEEAQARGLGVVSFQGRMVDHMNYSQAKDVLAMAQMIRDRKEMVAHQAPYVSLSEVFSRPQFAASV